MRIPPDFSGRVRLLERAAADAQLQSSLSVVAAGAFGAFPVGEDGSALVAAVPRWADMRLYPMLGDAIGRTVKPVPMEPDLVLGYIARVFLSADPPNFHTFAGPDFVKPENLRLLVTAKTENVPAGSMESPPGSLHFADLHLYSRITNLDRPEGELRTRPEGMEVPFLSEGGRMVVFGQDDGRDKLLLKMSYFYEGVENRHGFMGHATESLPVVLHPTELQIAGAGADWLDLWCFDRVVRASAGKVARCAYHFLNFGNRYSREMELKVIWAGARNRDEVAFRSGGSSWTLLDFERWFGYSPSSL